MWGNLRIVINKKNTVLRLKLYIFDDPYCLKVWKNTKYTLWDIYIYIYIPSNWFIFPLWFWGFLGTYYWLIGSTRPVMRSIFGKDQITGLLISWRSCKISRWSWIWTTNSCNRVGGSKQKRLRALENLGDVEVETWWCSVSAAILWSLSLMTCIQWRIFEETWISWMLHCLDDISLSKKRMAMTACPKVQISKISATKVESDQFKPKILRNSFRASDDLDGFFAFFHTTHIALIVFPEIGKWWTRRYETYTCNIVFRGLMYIKQPFLTILYACHMNH